jgi:hypothetical protein
MRAGLLVAVGALVVLSARPVGATGQEDDLEIVKKALAQAGHTSPAAADHDVRASSAATMPARPRWLKVRVIDKGEGKSKVTINLPLSLLAVLGDKELDWCDHHGTEGCHVKLKSVLDVLAAGQELVNIDSSEATVRAWIE